MRAHTYRLPCAPVRSQRTSTVSELSIVPCGPAQLLATLSMWAAKLMLFDSGIINLFSLVFSPSHQKRRAEIKCIADGCRRPHAVPPLRPSRPIPPCPHNSFRPPLLLLHELSVFIRRSTSHDEYNWVVKSKMQSSPSSLAPRSYARISDTSSSYVS